MIEQSGADRVVACATSAARDATNGHELLALGLRYGIPISIIDGQREAELAFCGTVGGAASSPLAKNARDDFAQGAAASFARGGISRSGQGVAIIDVGGGSTELIFGDELGLAFRASIDIGSVRLTERALPRHPVPADDLAAARALAAAQFAAALPPFPGQAPGSPWRSSAAIAIAGTATTLAALDLGMSFDASAVEGHALTVERARAWTERLAAMSVEERQALSGMDAQRADVIVGGGICLEAACAAIGARDISISTRGLRYGIAMREGAL
jgi:exopolyphosphatase/guanosine-5'-triphosphate,3'-diphosphate pyrophosphatase